MTGKVFISYRRGDDPGNAGRLFDSLRDAFKPGQLFMDVDNIEPGQDFVRLLEDKVAQCDVLLAVIGVRWTNATDSKGNRRLNNPRDFVRIEIGSALLQQKRVIPVLVGDAEMPTVEELPEDLQPLTERQAVRVTHESFRSDAKRLIKALRKILDAPDPKKQQPEAENGGRLKNVLEALDEQLTIEIQRQNAEPPTSEPRYDRLYSQDYARLSRLVSELEEHDITSLAIANADSGNLESELEQLMAVLGQREVVAAAKGQEERPEGEFANERLKLVAGVEDDRIGELVKAIEEQLEVVLFEEYGIIKPKQKPSV